MQMPSPLAIWLCLLAAAFARQAGAEEKFRTDENDDQKLPWYQLKPGEFPPDGSAHYFSGELIAVDHVNRRATLRVDRTDRQRRSHWDLPVDIQMLPYGSIRYHGAPAALRDIPIGTHLHGLFYLKDPDAKAAGTVFHNRKSLEADFTRALLLEDDFSYYTRRQRAWRIESVQPDEGKLTVVGVSTAGKQVDAKPIELEILPATCVYQGNQILSIDALAPGQIVLANLTWATLYGPGRCTHIWIDAESRKLAAERQRARHRQHQKQRGLAGWIDAVDNQKRILTVTLFGGVDPSLFEDFSTDSSVTVIVAEPSLRSYDQVNDRKSGPVVSIDQVPLQPGSSGIQIRCQPSLLLEGFRPGRIVRLFPSGWPIISIPLEERLWPARD